MSNYFYYVLILWAIPFVSHAQLFGGQVISSAEINITALNCNTAVNSGTLNANSAATGVSSEVTYFGGNGAPHNGQIINSTGVLGLTATLLPGNFAVGNGSLTYVITGTPVSSGIASFALNIGGQNCVLTFPVNTGVGPGGTSTCGAANIHNPSLSYGSITDQEGNVYNTIIIGNQEWMAENLKTRLYRNGSPIALVTNNSSWNSLTTGAYCWYNNDSLGYDCPYGKMYNWYAVNDSRGLCPTGWHEPTDQEWNTLISFLDPGYIPIVLGSQSQIAGGVIKSTNSIFWSSPNLDASNTTGFSALPGGGRDSNGFFGSAGNISGFWTKQAFSTVSAWTREVDTFSGSILRYNYNKRLGYYVRCLKD